ncbi:hypothetical protein AAK706_04790 [Erysipelotrichaceae bacterium 66-17]
MDDQKEKERRKAFMKTYGISEDEMDFFGYVHYITHTALAVIIVLTALLILAILALVTM